MCNDYPGRDMPINLSIGGYVPASHGGSLGCRPWGGLQKLSVIRFQALTHADDVVEDISNAPIEIDHVLIGGSHLKIDLRTPRLLQQPLGFGDNQSRETTAAIFRRRPR